MNKQTRRILAGYLILAALLFFFLLFNLNTGSVSVSPGKVLSIVLSRGGSGTQEQIGRAHV